MNIVIIPCYNERANIKKIVSSIFLQQKNTKIIVVDDNSPDNTSVEIEKLQKKYRNIYLLKRAEKGGRGSAVMAGLKYAFENFHPDFFIEMDADFSHDPSNIPKLIREANNKTVVIGSRYIKGSKIIGWSLKRRIISKVSNFLIKIWLRLPIVDNTNGYRCYPKEAASILLKHRFKSSGYVVLSECAYILSQSGFSFVEIPTVFVNRTRGKSKATIKEFVTSFYDLIGMLIKIK